MNKQALTGWLRLASLLGVHTARLLALVEKWGDAQAVCEAPLHALRAAGLTQRQVARLHAPDMRALDHVFAWLKAPDHHVLTWADADYPAQLKAIADPPLVLYIWGDRTVLLQDQLAMVGSRHPSANGRRLAWAFARAVSQAGLVVTSGLALGIDGASHEGALSVGGKTVAVLGGGIEQLYPKQHTALAEQIVAHGGAVVSEYGLSVAPRAAFFPRRNRVISGLSLGTCVVEAALRSGSLITARLANEQGRDVFALPGSVLNPLSRGCHALIQEGAKLVVTAEDILSELYGMTKICQERVEKTDQSPQTVVLTQQQAAVLAAVGYESTSVDQIVGDVGLAVAIVTSELLMLEIHGYIKSAPGGFIRVVS